MGVTVWGSALRAVPHPSARYAGESFVEKPEPAEPEGPKKPTNSDPPKKPEDSEPPKKPDEPPAPEKNGDR
jgi:hypothetical protein